ncbi:6923_t:CDS:1, partial [Dentiscutata heterogama]
MAEPTFHPKKTKIRSYTPVACTNCRIKKEKCTGTLRCSNCERRNLECIYIKSNKKRGPLPKSDRATLITPDICNLLNPI